MKDELFIIDDHRMVRFGLKNWLEIHTKWKVTQNFATSQECVSYLESLDENSDLFPEIIIIDVQLMEETGFKLLKEISQKYPAIKCVMYSMYDTAGYVLQAIEYGAKGYISKVATEEELSKCLEIVQSGNTYLEKRLVESQNKLTSILSVLTKQERHIFEFLLQGKRNEEIASSLFITIRTVENYTSRLYDKLNVLDREELLRKYK
ncbi:MAG: response regulator transcription factor [Treponema sp.]|nr:response regulator transcription factor [Treponema sp.]